MCKIPLAALNEIVYDRKYADQNIRRIIADSIERHESTVSRVLNEETRLDQDQCARLGRDLSDKLDETRWTKCFVGNTYLLMPRMAGSSDGRFDDEAAKLLDYGGGWVRAMQEGDQEKAQSMLDKIRSEVISDMQSEIDRL